MKNRLRAWGLCLLLVGACAATPRAGEPADRSAGMVGGSERYDLFHPVPKDKLRDFDSDRPDQATGPHTVDAGHVQLEFDFANFTYDHHTSERDGSNLDDWNVLPVSVRVGVLPNVELDLNEDGYSNARTRNRSQGRDRLQSGFGDLTLRAKVNLFGNSGDGPALALVPELHLPTSTAHLASRYVEGGVLVAFGTKLPGEFTLTMSGGVEFIRSSGDAYYVADFPGAVSLSHGLGYKPLSAFVEFAADVTTERPSPVAGQVDAGLIYQINDNVEIDLDCFFGVTRAAADYLPFAGMSVRF